jgi:hypothetical protein
MLSIIRQATGSKEQLSIHSAVNGVGTSEILLPLNTQVTKCLIYQKTITYMLKVLFFYLNYLFCILNMDNILL